MNIRRSEKAWKRGRKHGFKREKDRETWKKEVLIRRGPQKLIKLVEL